MPLSPSPWGMAGPQNIWENNHFHPTIATETLPFFCSGRPGKANRLGRCLFARRLGSLLRQAAKWYVTFDFVQAGCIAFRKNVVKTRGELWFLIEGLEKGKFASLMFMHILWIFCSQSCWKKDCFCFSKLSTVLAGPLMSVLAHFSWWFSWYTTTNWQISYRTCYLSCKLLGNPTTPGCLCHTVSDLIGVIIFVTCAFTLWYSGFCCFSHKAIPPNIHCCRWKETRSHSAPNG